MVDYYSCFIKVQKLTSTTFSSVITHLKAIFARFGIPAEMVLDNGPQFNSEEIHQFSQSYGFITKSPYYPQANGLAERAVRTAKQLLQHNSPGPYKALLNYRATLILWCSLCPADLLMGRRIRTELPQMTQTLMPKWTRIRNSEATMKNIRALKR